MSQSLAVDSSVLVAVLKGEPESTHFLEVLSEAEKLVGWPTIFETRIWLLRHAAPPGREWFAGWIADPTTRAIPFDGELESLAASAFDRFGKGRHPAGLNFGDCMAYAVSARHEAPLLFKGGGFPLTDVPVHPASVP